jgi:hypothetical protein
MPWSYTVSDPNYFKTTALTDVMSCDNGNKRYFGTCVAFSIKSK